MQSVNRIMENNNKIPIALIISSLLGIVFGIVLIYYSYSFHQTVNENMHKDCKMCSVFQKDCPYTNKELNEQEYGNGPCRDMGYYEMLWKLSLGSVLVGLSIIVMVIYSVGYKILNIILLIKSKKSSTKHLNNQMHYVFY